MNPHHRTRIKFCGLTRVEDVVLAAALGVDAIGLIFATRSPRRLDLRQARQLRAAVPPFVAVVALTMDNQAQDIRQIVETVRPTLLQFHGDESPEDCARFGLPYLKAIPMAQPDRVAELLHGHDGAAGFVLDSHTAGGAGGSGQTFDWSAWPQDVKRPALLAGGLTPDNVFDAIRAVRPWAVDVSSGIESAPGVKDAEKMRRFVAEVRRADQTS